MPSPKAGNYRREEVYELGTQIAQQLGYKPNGDITAAIKKAGGTIEYRAPSDLEAGDSGSMIIHSIRNFTIYLSKYTSANRDRFTVAHELGHYVLHYFIIKKDNEQLEPMVCTRAGDGRVEWEANWFAAGFVMPEEIFKTIFNKRKGNLELVAAHFGVSRSDAEIRANYLGLGTP
ncbi:MAG: ImmA/IrrE family metallo-endopeptidase [Magnetococcus sp. YQC-5]